MPAFHSSGMELLSSAPCGMASDDQTRRRLTEQRPAPWMDGWNDDNAADDAEDAAGVMMMMIMLERL